MTLPVESYSCVMDFISVLFFASDPYADYEGVMAAENARLKAGYKSTRAARMMASHQIKYPPILRRTSGANSESGKALTRSWVPGLTKYTDFNGPHKTGLKHKILLLKSSVWPVHPSKKRI